MEGLGKKTSFTVQEAFDIAANTDKLPYEEYINRAVDMFTKLKDSEKAYRAQPHVKPFFDKLEATPFPECKLLTIPGLMDGLCEEVYDYIRNHIQVEVTISIWPNCDDKDKWSCVGWKSYFEWCKELRDESKHWELKDDYDNYTTDTERYIDRLFLKTWRRMFPYEAVPASKGMGEFVFFRTLEEHILLACPMYDNTKMHMPAVCAFVKEKMLNGTFGLDDVLVECQVWQNSYIAWRKDINNRASKCKRSMLGEEWDYTSYINRVDKTVVRRFIKYWNRAYPDCPAVARKWGKVQFL
jgi:hypothetical protein